MPCGLDSRGFPVSRYYHSMMDLDEEMTDFLRYLEDSRDEVADQSESDLVRLIHTKVRAVKQSKVREAEYMKLRERDEENFRSGEEKGRIEGRSEGLREGEVLNIIRMTRSLIEKGKPLDILADLLEKDSVQIVKKVSGWILAEENLSDEEILRRISGQ